MLLCCLTGPPFYYAVSLNVIKIIYQKAKIVLKLYGKCKIKYKKIIQSNMSSFCFDTFERGKKE